MDGAREGAMEAWRNERVHEMAAGSEGAKTFSAVAHN